MHAEYGAWLIGAVVGVGVGVWVVGAGLAWLGPAMFEGAEWQQQTWAEQLRPAALIVLVAIALGALASEGAIRLAEPALERVQERRRRRLDGGGGG